MNLDSARAQMDLATESTQKQIEVNQQMLTNNLDAADRIIMRKAAEATITIASTPTPDPQ
jgi:hypothetical protein